MKVGIQFKSKTKPLQTNTNNTGVTIPDVLEHFRLTALEKMQRQEGLQTQIITALFNPVHLTQAFIVQSYPLCHKALGTTEPSNPRSVILQARF